MKNPRNFIAAVLFALFVSGCNSLPSGPAERTTVARAPEATQPVDASSDQPDQSDAETEPANAIAAPTPVSERPIPDQAVLPLLTAEFALREQEFDLALDILSEQAMSLEDPAVARRALKLAEFRRDASTALKMAIRLTKLAPDDAAAPAAAMGMLVRNNEPERALEFARMALARGARINAPAILSNFEALPADTQNRMIDSLQLLSAQFPDNLDIAIAVALAHKQLGDIETCIYVLDPLLDQHPDEERALVLWTQALSIRGDADPYDRIRRSLERSPEREPLRAQFARLLASDKRLDEARAQFQTLSEIAPRNGEYLLSLGLIDLESEALDAARDSFEALLALGQNIDEANYYLGRIAEQTEDIYKALDYYAEVGPGREFMDAMRRAATLALTREDMSRYERHFAQARLANPGEAERLFALQAELLKQKQKLAQAEDVYNEALAGLPESMPLQYSRAMLRQQRGDLEGMEGDLRDILEREPNNATTLNALGYTLAVHTNRLDEAAELIEQANKLSPEEPSILDSLGWVYFRQGRLQEALDHLEQAYKSLPDPEVAAHLGEVLWTMGRVDDARTIWFDALHRAPEHDVLNATLQRLGVVAPAIQLQTPTVNAANS